MSGKASHPIATDDATDPTETREGRLGASRLGTDDETGNPEPSTERARALAALDAMRARGLIDEATYAARRQALEAG